MLPLGAKPRNGKGARMTAPTSLEESRRVTHAALYPGRQAGEPEAFRAGTEFALKLPPASALPIAKLSAQTYADTY